MLGHMSHEAKIHPAQTQILRELLFVPSARFADLQKLTALGSDHVKFHIARLVEVGYVVKSSQGDYSLTTAGKEYANKLDTDRNLIERQPKSAVILVLEHDGKLLVQERLKHPYYGFWGFPGGKIRWGETIMEAAARELEEETGLSAELTFRGVYHELTKSKETGEVLEDKIFQIVFGKNPTGELAEKFDGGRNAWLTLDEVKAKDKVYKSFDTEYEFGIGKEIFSEQVQIYDQGEF
jgi:8-oxo-dGTP pyrophosphatase MutT (NUDIX family)